MEKRSQRRKLYLVFTDLQKAYDRQSRKAQNGARLCGGK